MAKIPLDDSPPPDEIEKVLFVSSNPTEGKETFGGYDPNYFIDKFTEMELELISCVVCKGIIREACSTDENHVCVVCLQGLASFKPMTSVRNTVSKRNIKCPLLRDCEWIGKIHEAEIHLKQCGSFRITCSLECGSVMKRCELESHTNTTCPLREVQCRNCNIIVLAKELKDHLTTCLKLPIRCKCEKEIPRDAMDMHVETDCPLAEVECPYAKYSCKIGSVLRKDMLAHKNKFYIEHQDMLEERHINLENEHKKLENEHIKLENEHINLENEHKKLENEHNKLENGHIKLENEHKILENEHIKLENEHNKLENGHIKLENEHKILENEHKKLENEHKILENEHKKLENEHIKLENEHINLENEHKILENEHKKLENVHNKLENGHIKLENEMKVECKDLKDKIIIKKNLNFEILLHP